MTTFCCVSCRRTVKRGICCPVCKPNRINAKLKFAMCRACINFDDGCQLLPKPCRTFEHLLKDGSCPAGRFRGEDVQEVDQSITVQVNVVIPTPARKLAVCSVAIGQQAQELAQYTGPQIEAYAERCNADMVWITQDQCPEWPIANKFQVQCVAEQYEQTLFVDVDVWIKDDSPNLFEFGPGVWMHDDTPYLKCRRWFDSEAARIAASQGMPKHDAALQCWNSGVVLCDREHAAIWAAPEQPIRPTHTAEQTHICLIAKNVNPLPTRWNSQWWMKGWPELCQDAWFIHLASMPHQERVKWLRFTSEARGRGSYRTPNTAAP